MLIKTPTGGTSYDIVQCHNPRECLLFRFEARDIDGIDDRSIEKHMRDVLVTIIGLYPALNRLVELV